MITLFHAPKSRSSRFLFLLEELNVPYRVEYVDIPPWRRVGRRRSQEPPTPTAKSRLSPTTARSCSSRAPSPAMYLTDKFPEAGIGPTRQPTHARRLSLLARVLHGGLRAGTRFEVRRSSRCL